MKDKCSGLWGRGRFSARLHALRLVAEEPGELRQRAGVDQGLHALRRLRDVAQRPARVRDHLLARTADGIATQRRATGACKRWLR
eukprot:6210423-Pleurochrysis_carterae.AAC.4